ncbi:MAG: C39 family peptidase [Clostridia bacterium]|nr:C39 family peptidase [Clostridia bacterium]
MQYYVCKVISMLWSRRTFCAALVLFTTLLMAGCVSTYTPRFVDGGGQVNGDSLVAVSPLSQYPDYPTGCESVTAVMALHHAGVSISVEDFIVHHLPCDERFYEENGLLYGPDPYAVFIGDPRTPHSFGCMAPAIEQALLSCVGEGERVANTTGEALSVLCRDYIDYGIPVILWATMEMRPVSSGRMWFLPDGRQFTWPAGEHCLLLVGYNEKEYLFNDPRYGTTVAYEKEAVEVAYAALGKQSLVIE